MIAEKNFWLISFFICFNICIATNTLTDSYKAAVYEHPVVLPMKKVKSYDEAVEQMMVNLKEYRTQADIAGSQGVDILVFPEDGIYGFNFSEPNEIKPYLEYIPDPNEVDWTPCEESKRFRQTEVQAYLSCIAKRNSLYVVANMGDAQPCETGDPNCPENGQYQFNTNVVFNRKGKLIAKYHKQNLFFENQFQEPVHPEHIVFETEFGKFGTFTCFDILFHDPAIPLVEEFNITDVLFPTAWMDALPFFSAIGFHSSFAFAYNVNFLAANVHSPLLRFQGSGIYSPNGAIDFYYDRSSSKGRLIVSDVPIINRKLNNSKKTTVSLGATRVKFLPTEEFKAEVFHDWYNFVSLQSRSDNVTICQEGHCCFLSYDRNEVVGKYAFGVFNGIHQYDGPYYLQVCILLKCASKDSQSCGQLIFTADGLFEYINIKGNFSTPYVTPQFVLSNNGSLELPPLQSMTYDANGLTGSAKTTPLLEASLIGRVYEND